MAYEQKDNSGTLFNNDRKTTANQPDRSGSALIDGVEYWVSGWGKEGPKGPFISLAFKRKDAQAVKPQSISQRAMPKRPDPISTGRDMDDEIPF